MTKQVKVYTPKMHESEFHPAQMEKTENNRRINLLSIYIHLVCVVIPLETLNTNYHHFSVKVASVIAATLA